MLLALILTAFSQAQKKENAIHVEVIGKGKPILFIPGFAIPGSSWHATVTHLKDDYECHLVTLAGFGGTKPIDFPWLPKVNQAML